MFDDPKYAHAVRDHFKELNTAETKNPELVKSNSPQGQALRYDGGKVRLDLVAIYPLMELAKVYTMGAVKYAPENWRKGMAWSRMYGSAMRHILAFQQGEEVDEESGLPHLAHAIWNLFSLLDYTVSHPELDDRWSTIKSKARVEKLPEITTTKPRVRKANGRSTKSSRVR